LSGSNTSATRSDEHDRRCAVRDAARNNFNAHKIQHPELLESPMSSVHRNHRTTRQARRWGVVIGTAAAAAAAAMIAMGTAHADTPDDVIGQAVLDLNQGAAVLDAAPTADLSAEQAKVLAEQATFSSQLDSALDDELRSGQDGLSAGDQTFLANVDEQLVSASQNILSADQAFVAADQAGDLSGSGFASADLTLLEADLGFLPAAFDAAGASLLAELDPDIGSLLP
jgi:hypothetical protein